MSSLLISGGLVASDVQVRRADLLVRDGRIADILEPGTTTIADVRIDASGLHVLPGIVDAHVHFNEPGRTDWEGFLSGTSAAAAGGTTTIADMPLNSHPPTLDARALALKRGAVAEHALVDYCLWGGVVPESIEHLAELRDAGVVGIKAFLCDSGLAEFRFLDEFALLDALQYCARLGLLLAVHAEDATTTSDLGQQARAQGQRAPLDWARSRPPSSEVAAVERVLEHARATGAAVHFVHISTGEAARRIARERQAGLNVSVETCPHYLALSEADLARLGALAKCAPPLRPMAVVNELWTSLLGGEVDFIASDHSPCSTNLKTTDDIWAAWGGISGVQTLLATSLTQAVHARGLPLPRLVHLLAANPARRLGLYPTKGSLQPGADADLVLVDLERAWTLGPELLRTRWPVSPFVGATLRGQVVATLVRGQTVYREGGLLVEPGFGREVRAR